MECLIPFVKADFFPGDALFINFELIGPRLCIGREMTLGQMAIALQVILAPHHVGLPQPWTRPRPEALVTIHPRGGMPLTLTHR